MYADRDLYVLDAVLDSLDPSTSNHVASALITGALVGRTRVVVSSHPRLLKHCDVAVHMVDGVARVLSAAERETTVDHLIVNIMDRQDPGHDECDFAKDNNDNEQTDNCDTTFNGQSHKKGEAPKDDPPSPGDDEKATGERADGREGGRAGARANTSTAET